MGLISEAQLHKYRTWKTVCISLLFCAYGLHAAIFGPSLIDLMVQVNTSKSAQQVVFATVLVLFNANTQAVLTQSSRQVY